MKTGLECFLEAPTRYVGKSRVGLLANPTSVDARLRHAVDLLYAHTEVSLTLLFGPEHGLRGEAQDMVSVADARDPVTDLPEVSLYGTTEVSLTPQPEHLKQIDILAVDLQDIGSRYYTYAATMALCMRACGAAGVRVLVFDRPNPIGGVQVEGGGLERGLENFCGLFPIPQRHGMTIGELARLLRGTFGVHCDLEVIACDGWKRTMYFDQLGLPWVLPSPNMPTLEAAVVYPGMCLIEGTNLSEARGTTKPFELVGAPFIDGRKLSQELTRLDLPGVVFRPCVFRPTFHKFAHTNCGGVQLHVTNRRDFLAYRTGLAVIWAAKQLWPDQVGWRREPYEFRRDVPAFDLLTGKPAVRAFIDAGASFDEVMRAALGGTEAYDAGRAAALLYE